MVRYPSSDDHHLRRRNPSGLQLVDSPPDTQDAGQAAPEQSGGYQSEKQRLAGRFY